MFICDVTGKVSKAREPQIVIVDEVRKVRYTNIVDGEMRESFGTEIVKELRVTKEGQDLYNFAKLTTKQ